MHVEIDFIGVVDAELAAHGEDLAGADVLDVEGAEDAAEVDGAVFEVLEADCEGSQRLLVVVLV